MRKQHFARLDLERLDKLILPNMLWGPVGPSLFFDQAALEPPSLVGPQSSSQGRSQTHCTAPLKLDHQKAFLSSYLLLVQSLML
jgi:hypothetical protein